MHTRHQVPLKSLLVCQQLLSLETNGKQATCWRSRLPFSQRNGNLIDGRKSKCSCNFLSKESSPVLQLGQNNLTQLDVLETDLLGEDLQKGSWWVTS